MARACGKCGGKGHNRRTCKKQRKATARTCGSCGEAGHNSRTCQGSKTKKAARKATSKGSGRACGQCGDIGHNRRTCQATTPTPTTPTPPAKPMTESPTTPTTLPAPSLAKTVVKPKPERTVALDDDDAPQPRQRPAKHSGDDDLDEDTREAIGWYLKQRGLN